MDIHTMEFDSESKNRYSLWWLIMFQNTEYILAMKDTMNLEVNPEFAHFKEAFNNLYVCIAYVSA